MSTTFFASFLSKGFAINSKRTIDSLMLKIVCKKLFLLVLYKLCYSAVFVRFYYLYFYYFVCQIFIT